MNISDVIKKSVLERFNSSTLGTTDILITLLMALGLGLYIYFVYRVANRNGFYNRNLNKSLASIPVITASIIMAMQSNLVISLGMVGALSIVRFRNAVKDPIDLTYLFWSISIGIIVGAGLWELAILLSLSLTLFLFLLDVLPALRAPFLLVVSADPSTAEDAVLPCIRKYGSRVQVRSRNISPSGTDWIFELQSRQPAELVRSVSAIDGVSSANLISHDGDVRY